MATSLVKFFSKTQATDGRKLFWDRAEHDGYPYRGPAAPMMSEDEYEARTVRVMDAKCGFFNMEQPSHRDAYMAVIDAIANGWFQLLHVERFLNGSLTHYVEWVEYYLEDGTRAQYNPHVHMNMEAPNNGPGFVPLPPR